MPVDIFYTTESEIREPAVRRRLVPRAGAVADAVVLAAHPAPAADDALAAVARAGGIFLWTGRVVVGVEEVAAPFPHVAGHVVQAVAVRREGFDGRDAGEMV